MDPQSGERHLGLFGSTALGVGAIVGGGILALAGVGFAAAGPAAIIAFALNGGIALLTAASFARLARSFPESGGIYTYSKKVLSIEAAFIVGWVVWFASILAGVLYALGFAAFAAEGGGRLLELAGGDGTLLESFTGRSVLALGAVGAYIALLLHRAAGGGLYATIGKVAVFVVLIAAGMWAWLAGSPAETVRRLDPFAPSGGLGVLTAMGYTFIALQGFDLIAAVGGEVREPDRTLPRAMYLSLGIALAIYLPLLFILATVGAPEGGITAAAAANPEGVVAEAAERFLGPTGYWLVVGAGILSMLSALYANLLGASRVSFTMARDRTLPRLLGRLRAGSGTPGPAVAVTGAMVAAIAVAIGDVGAAGAASSLIFLISFAMVHWASILASRRAAPESASAAGPGRAPLPFVGIVLCLGLGAFQAFAVPQAGTVVATWLILGAALYLAFLAPGARMADASAEARDPQLARLRGRSPLVLVPIANPASAASLVGVAASVRTPGVGRILLLSVIRPLDGRTADAIATPGDVREVPADAGEASADVGKSLRDAGEALADTRDVLGDAQEVLGEALRGSLERRVVAETLFTIAPEPWTEIARVARGHGCETVLVGLPRLAEPEVEKRLDGLLARLDTDVVIVRAPRGWRIEEARRILVPLGGRRDHSHLRARLLSSFSRAGERHVTFLRTVPAAASPETRRRLERFAQELARDEAACPYDVVVEYTDEPADAIVAHAAEADFVVMGIRHRPRHAPELGSTTLRVARDSDVPLILLGRRSARPFGRIGPSFG